MPVTVVVNLEDAVRFALIGLLIALVVFAASGGHLLFLPLLFVLPLGGLFGHHRRHGHFWYRNNQRYSRW